MIRDPNMCFKCKYDGYLSSVELPNIRLIKEAILPPINNVNNIFLYFVTSTSVLYPTNAKTPNTADVVSWKSEYEAVATVSDAGVVHAVAEGETDITAYVEGTDIEATCHVEVSDTAKVFRIIGPSELDESKSYFLCAEDTTSLVYAKGEMSGYYVAVSDSEGTASAVQVIKSETKFKKV